MVDNPGSVAALDCCPPLEPCDVCDYIDVTFRLPFRPRGGAAGRVNVPVQIVLRFRLSRCSGPLSLGDIAYSTTLLPGESVRLFTSDRHSRFSFDSETDLSYRQHAASSTSVGEVSPRSHAEGSSEDQYESASRVFTNPNRCHALTYLFYKLNKCQILRWELIGIDRTVLDPAAPTDVYLNIPPPP